jgi:hypothetical protein
VSVRRIQLRLALHHKHDFDVIASKVSERVGEERQPSQSWKLVDEHHEPMFVFYGVQYLDQALGDPGHDGIRIDSRNASALLSTPLRSSSLLLSIGCAAA